MYVMDGWMDGWVENYIELSHIEDEVAKFPSKILFYDLEMVSNVHPEASSNLSQVGLVQFRMWKRKQRAHQ
jgi:hypothetical protein